MAIKHLLLLFLWAFGRTAFCQCPEFENIEDQAAYLTKLREEYPTASETRKLSIESEFFCAFPASFADMERLFGFDMKTGVAAPLYEFPAGMETILFFSNLKSIEPSQYYNRYIDINIDGYWQADNIGGAFVLGKRFRDDPDQFCKQLAKRTDDELLSVFRFMYDGPHPDQMKEGFVEFHSDLSSKNKRLGQLLQIAYAKLLADHDGHGK
ncbi:MAG: hypothetical protein RIF36_18115 [Imperialibacter sp.]|uniref:hypothetical protein n=1 Tax=Imperialibacter sp. TaxID=2038411 RepID=UPI0032ED55C6